MQSWVSAQDKTTLNVTLFYHKMNEMLHVEKTEE